MLHDPARAGDVETNLDRLIYMERIAGEAQLMRVHR